MTPPPVIRENSRARKHETIQYNTAKLTRPNMAAGIYRGKAGEKVVTPLHRVVSVRHRHASQVANGAFSQ